MLDNQYAILFIRGERPIMDFKYDIMKHPNVALTTDGKASPYKQDVYKRQSFICLKHHAMHSGISKFTSLHLRVSGILRANPMTKEM